LGSKTKLTENQICRMPVSCIQNCYYPKH